MNAHTLWQVHLLARHLSHELAPLLPADLWLLAHENQLILIRGTRVEALSVGAVELASVDAGMEDLPGAVEDALGELQDLVSMTIRAGWPGEGPRLVPSVRASGSQIEFAYLAPGTGWDRPGHGSVTLAPFEVTTNAGQEISAG